ncbi:FecR domain-containing protein [Mesorhizobium sp. ZMM04-5]|uniref:FecR domain-containing protein n=1 Tax=Mesorhizobium marinum TaxID=3228790 RepID=A0ABV3QW67_9HYPH
MRAWIFRFFVAGSVFLGAGFQVAFAQEVGKAVLINTSVTGNGRTLATSSPVHRNERIRTSSTGLGEFVFRDGTKFAVGWNSSVVIDKFVFDDDRSAKDLSVQAAKGSFRWISGRSKSPAYKIATPAGTIGVRGTAFDVYVGPGGVTAVVLLKGRVQFCGANGCRDLRRRCDFIVATPKGGVSDPARIGQDAIRKLRNARALPFVTGGQRLSQRFRVGNDCLTAASLVDPKTGQPGSNTPGSSNSQTGSPSSGPSSGPSSSSPGRGDTGGRGRRGDNGIGNGGGDGSPNGRFSDIFR